MKRKKTVIISIIVLVVIFVIFSGIKKAASKKKTKANTTQVRVETVGPSEFVEIVNAPGEIRPETEVDISAKVSARIVELPFDEGDTVTAGNPDTDPPVSPFPADSPGFQRPGKPTAQRRSQPGCPNRPYRSRKIEYSFTKSNIKRNRKPHCGKAGAILNASKNCSKAMTSVNRRLIKARALFRNLNLNTKPRGIPSKPPSKI